jgi:hypothetical protein
MPLGALDLSVMSDSFEHLLFVADKQKPRYPVTVDAVTFI